MELTKSCCKWLGVGRVSSWSFQYIARSSQGHTCGPFVLPRSATILYLCTSMLNVELKGYLTRVSLNELRWITTVDRQTC